MSDGAILANSGHFDVEINIKALEASERPRSRRVRDFLDEYTLTDGRRIYVAGEGRLGQPGRRRGPPERRDGHELRQPGAGCRVHSRSTATSCPKGLSPCPNDRPARSLALKLTGHGRNIDTLTPEQENYWTSWTEGTGQESARVPIGGIMWRAQLTPRADGNLGEAGCDESQGELFFHEQRL